MKHELKLQWIAHFITTRMAEGVSSVDESESANFQVIIEAKFRNGLIIYL